MDISVLDLFSVGIGPSSSHTVGPMRAARDFCLDLAAAGELERVHSVSVVLCGSLGATGEGHGTPDAVVAGLRGLQPETCDCDDVPGSWDKLGPPDGAGSTVHLLGHHPVTMTSADIRLAPLTRLPGHSNALRFTARDGEGQEIAERIAYSIGGGFVVLGEQRGALTRHGGDPQTIPDASSPAAVVLPFPFTSADELLAICQREGLSIAEVAYANECARHGAARVDAGLDTIWATMSACVDAGLTRQGVLPGRLRVKRRAAALRESLEASERRDRDSGLALVDRGIEWLQAFAMAVNEENADGRRVVTAPTNGAAGIIPAVGRSYLRINPGLDPEQQRRAMRRYLLTAGAIGALYKRNASISGAEAGCQGEVGSACSMAAGGFAALTGGSPEQVENAAEIAMEHNLGLTCDPVGGLVQVPCIERNAIAACTAVTAARLALQGDGAHVVSLDTVIETMRQTGLDMSTKYKETALGGLAVNVVEC